LFTVGTVRCCMYHFISSGGNITLFRMQKNLASYICTYDIFHHTHLDQHSERDFQDTYSGVPLILHLWDRTGAELSNILDYQTVSVLN